MNNRRRLSLSYHPSFSWSKYMARAAQWLSMEKVHAVEFLRIFHSAPSWQNLKFHVLRCLNFFRQHWNENTKCQKGCNYISWELLCAAREQIRNILDNKDKLIKLLCRGKSCRERARKIAQNCYKAILDQSLGEFFFDVNSWRTLLPNDQYPEFPII